MSGRRKRRRHSTQDEHPRHRLLANGAQALSDAELVEILLRNGGPGSNVRELARELLAEFGGLVGLANVNPVYLRRHQVSDAKAAAVVAALVQLGPRGPLGPLPADPRRRPSDRRLGREPQPRFRASTLARTPAGELFEPPPRLGAGGRTGLDLEQHVETGLQQRCGFVETILVQ